MLLRDSKYRIALGEADTAICQGLAARVKDWKQLEEAETETELEKIYAPYRSAGVDGDKLQLVGRYHNAIMAPGQADPTPTNVARANALFVLSERTDTHEWVLARYAFRRNRQIGRTERGFLTRPGPAMYR